MCLDDERSITWIGDLHHELLIDRWGDLGIEQSQLTMQIAKTTGKK